MYVGLPYKQKTPNCCMPIWPLFSVFNTYRIWVSLYILCHNVWALKTTHKQIVKDFPLEINLQYTDNAQQIVLFLI